MSTSTAIPSTDPVANIAPQNQTWTTREAAQSCGLSEHTLRWYERIGLLDRIERAADGRRRYGLGDVQWLVLLSRLRATGMPVREMQRYGQLVRSGTGEPERLALLEEHRRRVLAALVAQRECLDLLNYKIDNYRTALDSSHHPTHRTIHHTMEGP